MHTLSSKTLLASKRAQAFVSDLRKAGVPKGRSELMATKFVLLAQPERFGTLVKKTRKGRTVYRVDRTAKDGKILVYRKFGATGLGGKTLVVFAPTRAKRRTKSRK